MMSMMIQRILKIPILVDRDGTLTNQPADYWRSLIQDASGIIILFNDDDRSSFESIPIWLRFISAILDYFLPILIVCNQMEEFSQVSPEEVQEFGQKDDIHILFTNSITGESVQEIFTRITDLCDEFTFEESLKPELW